MVVKSKWVEYRKPGHAFITGNETNLAGERFKDLWQRMGLSVDWDMCYSTISDDVRKISQESFILLLKKGYVYRKYEPAPYCTSCRTSVAQAELDDDQKPSFFNDIVFSDEQGNDLIIGTTRPELLYSCVALIYNPKDTRYQHLKGKQARVPIFGFTVPILEDEHVLIEKGTGLVMCCTFGDKTDIEWFKKFNLPYKPSIALDGKWLPETGPLAGLRVTAAREKIIDLLKEQKLLLKQTPITHNVNVHERCKKEIEFLALPQWFLKILPYKDKFLEIGDQINWYPAFMKARYKDWVTNIGWDWCLSRQRFFGIPFPVWHCDDCQEMLVPEISALPVDPQETPFAGKKCTKCGSSNLRPDTDVMDTWNTSSLTPYILYTYFNPQAQSAFSDADRHNFLPTSMRPQAHDIIRTWAFDTIVKSWMHDDQKPWHNIIISGHVLSDTKGKISKSKEHNALAPETLMQTYSADAIRYWTASGGLGQDIAFSDAQIKIGQRLVTKLWNAFLFVDTHSAKQITAQPNNLGAVNEWILHHMSITFKQYEHYFHQHEFSLALDQIERFFWSSFCDNYLELIKDQLFKPEQYDAKTVEATRWTLNHIGLRILQLYAPYLPHVTETIYQHIYRPQLSATSIHQTRFTDIQHRFEFDASDALMSTIIALTSTSRKLKTEKQLSLKTELATLTLYSSDKQLLSAVQQHEQLIKGITHAHKIEYKQQTFEADNMEQHQEQWQQHIAL